MTTSPAPHSFLCVRVCVYALDLSNRMSGIPWSVSPKPSYPMGPLRLSAPIFCRVLHLLTQRPAQVVLFPTFHCQSRLRLFLCPRPFDPTLCVCVSVCACMYDEDEPLFFKTHRSGTISHFTPRFGMFVPAQSQPRLTCQCAASRCRLPCPCLLRPCRHCRAVCTGVLCTVCADVRRLCSGEWDSDWR